MIRGARQHNLKNIDLEIPRDKLIVFTGVSGSGKSSLAFDTIYAEGQRRYVESLSAYARQFLGQMDKPDVDSIEGLSPAISIDQKTTTHNPRSTVGTVTEIYDYLRLLYARVGQPHCPKCGQPIAQQTVEQMVDQLMPLPEGTSSRCWRPWCGAARASTRSCWRRSGARASSACGSTARSGRCRRDPSSWTRTASTPSRWWWTGWWSGPGIRSRLADSLETAAATWPAASCTWTWWTGEEMLFSQNFACPDCGISIDELAPRMFSFN